MLFPKNMNSFPAASQMQVTDVRIQKGSDGNPAAVAKSATFQFDRNRISHPMQMPGNTSAFASAPVSDSAAYILSTPNASPGLPPMPPPKSQPPKNQKPRNEFVRPPPEEQPSHARTWDADAIGHCENNRVSIRHLNDAITTITRPCSNWKCMKYGGRTTLVRLRSGGVAAFSPVELDVEIEAAVNALGPLYYIICPNNEHHTYMAEWARRWPDAWTVGTYSLQAKHFPMKAMEPPTLDFDVKLAPQRSVRIDPEFDDEFDAEYMSSHRNHEVVFNHRPSQTLIEGDLLYFLPTNKNSGAEEDGRMSMGEKMKGRLHRTQGNSLTRRMMWFMVCKGLTKEFGDSLRRIAAWDFDAIIPCHGDVVRSGGKRTFQGFAKTYLQA